MPEHPSFQSIDHRPWPLPATRWNWRQSWLDLAFLHYRVEADAMRQLIPKELEIQEFDGSAWVGVVPFRMAGVMRRGIPDMPGFSSFLELNVRTYVEHRGRPGVWFFSLDTNSWPFVFGGRYVYGLPYHPARMRQTVSDGWHTFASARRDGRASFLARYRPTGETGFANAGGFEHWATERYCLYSHGARRGLERVDVHHAPWPLRKAEAEISDCEILSAAGIRLEGQNPVCHFSTGVHVVSYPIEKLRNLPGPLL